MIADLVICATTFQIDFRMQFAENKEIKRVVYEEAKPIQFYIEIH